MCNINTPRIISPPNISFKMLATHLPGYIACKEMQTHRLYQRLAESFAFLCFKGIRVALTMTVVVTAVAAAVAVSHSNSDTFNHIMK